MADGDEIEALAGEYVLGTLDADERRAAEARLAADASFRSAVAGWERRLQPLADLAPGAAPPADAFARILATDRSFAGRRRQAATSWRCAARCGAGRSRRR